MFNFDVIFDIGVVGLRILMPVYAIFIVYQCYAAMRRRRRSEKPLVTLFNTVTGEKTPVVLWENSIGRGKANDITVNDPTVSRNHCVLLRRSEGWFVTDIGSTAGTYVNGEPADERTRVLVDDVISVGNTRFQLLRGDEYEALTKDLPESEQKAARAALREQLRRHKLTMDGNPTEAEVAEHYNQLDEADQDKDWKPFNRMLQLLKKYDGTRIYCLENREVQ